MNHPSVLTQRYRASCPVFLGTDRLQIAAYLADVKYLLYIHFNQLELLHEREITDCP